MSARLSLSYCSAGSVSSASSTRHLAATAAHQPHQLGGPAWQPRHSAWPRHPVWLPPCRARRGGQRSVIGDCWGAAAGADRRVDRQGSGRGKHFAHRTHVGDRRAHLLSPLLGAAWPGCAFGASQCRPSTTAPASKCARTARRPLVRDHRAPSSRTLPHTPVQSARFSSPELSLAGTKNGLLRWCSGGSPT